MKEKKSLEWLVPFIFLALMIGTAFVQGRVGQPWGGIAAFFTMGGYLLYMLVIRKKREKARQEEEPVTEEEPEEAFPLQSEDGAPPFLLLHHAFNARYYQVFRSAKAYRFVHVGNEFKGIDPDRMLEECPTEVRMTELKKSFSIRKEDVQRFTVKMKKSMAAPVPTSGVVTFYTPKKQRYDLVFELTPQQVDHFFSDLRDRVEKKEQAYHRQQKRSDKNMSLGQWRKENQKPETLRLLKKLTMALTVAGAALSLAFMFLPVPYELTAWALVALSLVTLALPLIFPAYYSLTRTTEEAKQEEGANAIGWMYPSVACGAGLTLRALMDFNFHSDRCLLVGLGIGAVMTLLYSLRCRELHRRFGWSLLVLFMTGFLTIGLSLELNYLLDTSEPLIEERVVLDKHISTSSKGPDSYYCTVELQGKEVDIDVGKEAYQTIDIGDTVEVGTRAGAFGMAYSEIYTEN